jgi:hypothetical protein
MKFRDLPKIIYGGNYAVDVPWSHLERWVEDLGKDGPLELDPDFQRGHVWDDPKRAKYVEYCLRGGQSSRSLWWNAKGWPMSGKNPVQIVDGKQRLEAVRKFLRNELTVFMHVRRQTEPRARTGWRYSDFTDTLGLNTTLRMHVNNLATREEVLAWYLDLNDGGVVHTDEELLRVKQLLEEEKKRGSQ